MNIGRLFLAILAAFIGVFATDFLIHGVWLQESYKQTMHLWRPEAEMQTKMGWMLLGQFLAASTFVVLWATGPAPKARLGCACAYGLFMALFANAGMIISYAVQPLPGELIAKWIAAGCLQGVVLGVIVFFAYKPGKACCKQADAAS